LPLQRATGRWQEDCHYVSFDTQGHRRDMPEYRSAIGAMVCAVGLVCFAQTVRAQSRPGKITGVVTDPAGAVVPNARVTISGPDGFSEEAPSDAQGRFAAAGLVPGEYRLQAAADGFVSYQSAGLRIRAGDTLSHNVRLQIASVRQEVTVDDTRTQLNVDPSSNIGAVVMSGSDLDALSDDPDDLAVDLQALAGPGVGPNGGDIFIDGFSNGRLPPKSSIREVRINQNPFSAEYDRLGFGRIEIFTKPGTDRFRGEASFNFGDSIFNSRNPFALDKPHSQRRMIEGNFAGPLSRRASFMIEAERRDMQETTIINALTVDPAFQFTPFRQAVVSPTANTEFNARLDYQLSANHTLVGRLHLTRAASLSCHSKRRGTRYLGRRT